MARQDVNQHGRRQNDTSPPFQFPPREDRPRLYDYYAMMRRDHPVAHDEAHDMWAVYRHEDVQRVLSDYALFSSGRERMLQRVSQAVGRHPFRNSLISTDPPRHRQLRQLVSKAFTPKAVADLEPRISEIADDLLDQVVDSGRMELIGDLSFPLPVIVIAELLGIPGEERAQFKAWSDRLIGDSEQILAGEMGSVQDRLALQQEMDDYFRGVIEQRRMRPERDLISGLVQAEIEGQRLSDEEVLAFCTLLLVAGNITTINLIGNAVLCLLEHPDQMDRLRADLSLMPTAIEEVLRYEAPVQLTFRTTNREVEIRGQRIPAGELVLASIGSANRDEAVFARADQFDITRDPNPHLSFGEGIHFCLGAPPCSTRSAGCPDEVVGADAEAATGSRGAGRDEEGVHLAWAHPTAAAVHACQNPSHQCGRDEEGGLTAAGWTRAEGGTDCRGCTRRWTGGTTPLVT
ncbi:MAG TPA: cytochrome P450 [Chloroflexota bacterium]|nr:cytochrome P450 [Chloroflexota bacterium]